MQNQLFRKFFQEYHQSDKQFGSRSGPTLCLFLFVLLLWSGSKLFAKVRSSRHYSSIYVIHVTTWAGPRVVILKKISRHHFFKNYQACKELSSINPVTFRIIKYHAYQMLECSTSDNYSKKRIKNRGMSCNRLCIPTFVVLSLWYKFEVRKFSRIVRFTFHIK